MHKTKLTALMANHIREVHFGGNWTASSIKSQLAGVTWQQAIAPVHGLNTIAKLVFHINYYIVIANKVLQGGPLEGKDSYSFDHPPINNKEDWDALLGKIDKDAETLARVVQQMPEEKLWEDFSEEKYGTCHKNIQGIIEHTHY
ncbi:MAG: DUF1572 domain-containing protein, partial [Marinirhabdus sp.]